jgi:signal transduction histidine kinase
LTGKGRISSTPDRRLRWLVAGHVVWLLLAGLLGIWWSRLVLSQAERISQLESNPEHYAKVQRMVAWETGTFLVLFAGTTAFLLWFYFRDHKRSRSLQAFFASVTHELRTPLTSIRLQAESIADSSGSDPDQKELVHRLLEDTTRLEEQVNRTLELARVEGGGRIYLEAVALGPWLERSLRDWNEANRDDGSARLTGEPHGLTVEADPSALQVIFRNLLENSVRHGKSQPITIEVRAVRDGGRVRVTYGDRGQGVQGDVSRLGGIFEKGANSQGAGVGLYLVKMLMQRMGGNASFRSKVDGYGFVAELDFAARSESAPESATESLRSGGRLG